MLSLPCLLKRADAAASFSNKQTTSTEVTKEASQVIGMSPCLTMRQGFVKHQTGQTLNADHLFWFCYFLPKFNFYSCFRDQEPFIGVALTYYFCFILENETGSVQVSVSRDG